MEMNRTSTTVELRRRRVAVSAFTLIDVLVSMVIITVLISLILPSIAGVREAARRVICSSNQRQVGLGFAMFSEDNQNQLPDTEHEPKGGVRTSATPQFTNIVRDGITISGFDGLGILFERQYLNAPQIFYCPSHHGDHPYAKYAQVWHENQGQVVVNYQYRGSVDYSHDPSDRLTLLSDCLATRRDYSHNVGANVLRADFSVAWLSDPSGRFANRLPDSETDIDAAVKVDTAWDNLDHASSASPLGGP